MTAPLRAPFPWFGGKRGAAALIWEAFGAVPNYVEPFAGSLAVLLARRSEPGTETVNDLDGLLVNAWRGIAWRADEVAQHADWPVSEADLSARHLALVRGRAEVTDRLQADPEWCDPKLAGWWVWGACCWIAGGWCSGDGPWVSDGARLVLGNAGQGINRQLPHLGNAGQGVNRQLPHLGNAGRGIRGEMERLSARLRRVRIACGDWRRVLGDSVTWRHGVTGVLLDPPYSEGKADYAVGGRISADVAAWALEAGRRPDMRIALCGYEGEHHMPGWRAVSWTARGGYGNQGGEDDSDNRHRETIWFSPACLGASQADLFGSLGDAS